MSAASSKRLAEAMTELVMPGTLISRALNDEFNDFLSPHAMPQHALVEALGMVGDRAKPLIKRVIDGEFDSDLQESKAWAESDEGTRMLRGLGL